MDSPTSPFPAVAIPAARPRRMLTLRGLARWLALGALCGGIVVGYLFFVTAGKLNGFPGWPTYNTNFDMQAEGYRHRHLHLSLEPAAELVGADDPFSPEYSNYWARDLTLYKGHYYIYWGPFPALALWAVKSVFRIRSVVGDQYLLFSFNVLSLLAGSVLIWRAARRLFPSAPFVLSLLGILAFAFANPTPFLLASAGVYQTAIVSAQAMLIVGLAVAFEAIGPAAQRTWLRRIALIAAGTCWGMAIACRVSVGPVVLALSLATMAAVWLRPDADRRWIARLGSAGWLTVPIAVTVALLLAYNKARFGEWLEFGQRFQLNDAALRFRMSFSYVFPNLYSYLLRPVVRTCHFPYAKAVWDIGLRGFPKWYTVPPGYMIAEPIAGILLSMPWSWLAPVGLWAGARLVWRARKTGALAKAGTDDDARRGLLWYVACAGILGTLTALPWVAVFSGTMRYLADVSSGLALCGIVGAWWLYTRVREHHVAVRILVVAAIAVLAILTAAIGALLGFGGYMEHFHNNNPQLMDRLEASLSICGR